ncbi:Hexosyltransferase [Psidium guajava]|nr:Hexosyltransferase [Psidium guajava]
MPVRVVGILGLSPIPLQLRLLLRLQHAELLQDVRHRVMDPPPALVRDVTGKLLEEVDVPVAVVVPKAKPRLHS